MSQTVVVIEGDGIGPEVVSAAERCIDATDADITFERAVMGEQAVEQHGTPLPEETVAAVRDAGVALKGPVTTPVGSGFRSVNVALRRELDLYANVRPCRYMDAVPSRIDDPDDIDIVIVRENLEDLYTGIEFDVEEGDALTALLRENGHEPPEDAAYSIKPISRRGSERVIRHAFDYAAEHGRGKVTVVDKANIMKATDGLFMAVGEAVAAEYDIEHEHLLVDNMAQQLVMHPEDYDVIATQNIYGDILSDLAAGLIGGVGVVPSANIGDDTAVFASVHGSAPDIAGTGQANPVALIRSGAMLLDHIGEEDAAAALRDALSTVTASGPVTPDIGGAATTEEVAAAVIEAM